MRENIKLNAVSVKVVEIIIELVEECGSINNIDQGELEIALDNLCQEMSSTPLRRYYSVLSIEEGWDTFYWGRPSYRIVADALDEVEDLITKMYCLPETAIYIIEDMINDWVRHTARISRKKPIIDSLMEDIGKMSENMFQPWNKALKPAEHYVHESREKLWNISKLLDKIIDKSSKLANDDKEFIKTQLGAEFKWVMEFVNDYKYKGELYTKLNSLSYYTDNPPLTQKAI